MVNRCDGGRIRGQRESITVALRVTSTQRLAPPVTGRPHTDNHALCSQAKSKQIMLERKMKALIRRYSCRLRLQQDWNADHCFEGHLTTMEDQRQFAPQCLHADLCRSLSDARCCSTLLGLLNFLGKRSLVQLIH